MGYVLHVKLIYFKMNVIQEMQFKWIVFAYSHNIEQHISTVNVPVSKATDWSISHVPAGAEDRAHIQSQQSEDWNVK